MKNISILTLAAVVSTISLALPLVPSPYAGVLYATIACVFLLLTATTDYASTRSRYRQLIRSAVSPYPASTSTHRLPLAA